MKVKKSLWTDVKDHEIEQLLDLVELTEKRRCKIFESSGGQKLRVAIARKLDKKPNVLIFVEPTGSAIE